MQYVTNNNLEGFHEHIEYILGVLQQQGGGFMEGISQHEVFQNISEINDYIVMNNMENFILYFYENPVFTSLMERINYKIMTQRRVTRNLILTIMTNNTPLFEKFAPMKEWDQYDLNKMLEFALTFSAYEIMRLLLSGGAELTILDPQQLKYDMSDEGYIASFPFPRNGEEVIKRFQPSHRDILEMLIESNPNDTPLSQRLQDRLNYLNHIGKTLRQHPMIVMDISEHILQFLG